MGEKFIEYPAVHNTFTEDAYGVFDYDVYEEWSVLAGQEKRSCLGSFVTLAEAKSAFPEAKVSDSSGFADRPVPTNPPEWFDEANAGEHWSEEDAY